MKFRIVFLKIGTFSGTNDFTLAVLREQFPSCEIDVVDVWKDLVPYYSAPGLIAALREFGPLILWHNYGSAVLRTRRTFNEVRRAVARRVNPAGTAFTFQTTSFFDLSVPGVPHFVFIDGSHLSVAAQFRQPSRFLPRIIAGRLFRPCLFRRDPAGYTTIRGEIAMAVIEQYVRDPVKIGREHSVFHAAARVFTMSTGDRNVLIRHYGCPAEKAVCVYQGSHLEPRFRNNLQRYRNRSILFVGREWNRKGGPELIAAFRQVRRKHPEVTLTIAGCAPILKESGCVVTGRLSPEDLSRYYEQASVFCTPSRVEAFGNVFVEALHYRLPVVAFRTGALPDMVADGVNGYLVEPGNVDELAAALVDLLGDPERCREFGERGYQVAREKYTWERTGMLVKEQIQSALEKGQARQPESFEEQECRTA